jgi:hypothetical protein
MTSLRVRLGISDQPANHGSQQVVDTERSQSAFRQDQPRQEDANHTNRDRGFGQAHGFEGVAIELQNARVVDRDGSGGAGSAEHDAQLAEEIPGAQPCNCPMGALPAARQLDLTAPDDVEPVARFTFIEDGLTRLQVSLVRASFASIVVAVHRAPP